LQQGTISAGIGLVDETNSQIFFGNAGMGNFEFSNCGVVGIVGVDEV
jgi:hypothetical protein